MEKHSKTNKTPIALVDIDETICFYNGDRVYEEAIPSKENIAKINKLYDDGWKIIYWTARGGTNLKDKKRLKYLRDLTSKHLHEWGAKFHELQMGDKKPLNDLIIDDKSKRIEEL